MLLIGKLIFGISSVMRHEPFMVPHTGVVRLSDYDPKFTGKFKSKDGAEKKLKLCVKQLKSLQEVLYAKNDYAVLIILQGMDTAGKDSTVKYVMSGVNPMGCQVFSFKAPSTEELEHDYLWRAARCLPERGRIGIFNRSYYEEVLVVRVHPELFERQHIPHAVRSQDLWQARFGAINNFEQHLVENGTVVLKFFLNLSKEEQKKRFLDRIEMPEKNWKFSLNDIRERKFWDDYMCVYEDMLGRTNTPWAPWHVIPADHKWFTRVAIADILIAKLRSLNLCYPVMSKEEHQKNLAALRKELETE